MAKMTKQNKNNKEDDDEQEDKESPDSVADAEPEPKAKVEPPKTIIELKATTLYGQEQQTVLISPPVQQPIVEPVKEPQFQPVAVAVAEAEPASCNVDGIIEKRLETELSDLPVIAAEPKVEVDAEIDARLMEQLNSLPMVAAEPEPVKQPEAPQVLPAYELKVEASKTQTRFQTINNYQPRMVVQSDPAMQRRFSSVINLPPLPQMPKTVAEYMKSRPNALTAQIQMRYLSQSKAPVGQLNAEQVRYPSEQAMQVRYPSERAMQVRYPSERGMQVRYLSQSKQPLGQLSAEQMRYPSQGPQMRYLSQSRPPVGQSSADAAMQMRYPSVGGMQMRYPSVRREALQTLLVEDDEVDFEEIGVADTYSSYWPSKLKGGSKHPDAVVETATLSSVELPDITYELMLPEKLQSSDRLSALQLEAVTYACQAHEQLLPSGQRAGFLLGDGAGVGKGRTIAAIIYENYLRGRKRAVWISVSNDLKFDAERDLQDIGAGEFLQVSSMSKFKYSRISGEENGHFRKGVIFCTYTALIGESANANPKYNTRLRQLTQWMGPEFDGLIVLDECHKAKNLSLMNAGKSTKTGTTVLELQQLLPMARVVYASATGASEPRNMAYMVRLGLWGPGTSYSEFFKFVNTVEKRGIGAMEIVAMDMKLRGSYIARQLSFKDVTFRIEEVPMTREFHKLYNHSAELWADINEKFLKSCRLMCIENRVQKIITCQFWSAHQRFFKNLCIASKVRHVVRMVRAAARESKAVVIGLQSTGESRTLEHLELYQCELSSFVSTAKMIVQSFVEKYFPAPTREALYKLLNTGTFEVDARSRAHPKRARLLCDWSDDELDFDGGDSDLEFDAVWNEDEDKLGRKRRGRPPKPDKVEKTTMQERILQHLCNNLSSLKNEPELASSNAAAAASAVKISERDVERCIAMREKLLERIEHLGRRMPPNTLDKIICKLGVNVVAEMTGRRGRVIKTPDGVYSYEQRCEADISMDLVNYKEKQRFMDDTKHVAIISEAASSGISLQSDKRLNVQRRRLHITLELPWSADRAIQQFGRTHRSNQANAPEYVFLISDLGGESRFAATVAKRLESLGALTQGDRRATDARDLSRFNIDNSIGRSALESVLQQITSEKPLESLHVPEYKGDFCFDCCVALSGVGILSVSKDAKGQQIFVIEKDSSNIPKFLNRILGCRVEVQNALFKFFLNKMYSLILQMKRAGHFDLGILDLDAHGSTVSATKLIRFIRNHATGTAATELHTLEVLRGMSFEMALAKYKREARQSHEGFYVYKQERNSNNCAILCLNAQPDTPADTEASKLSLKIYRPNTGPQVRPESLSAINQRFVKASLDAVQHYWDLQYSQCVNSCSHIYWNRRCPFGTKCGVGLRVRQYHVLSGLMLPIWDRIALIIEKDGRKIQMIRAKTVDNKKIVGTVVPDGIYQQLVADLSSDSRVECNDLQILQK
ncbi:sno [Drosophila busckii]|uniref:Sno n=2 Tax=Drosophila busckii TaxID=30019 RepID=A0A0M4EA29_DROBS|nr:sno [Drosophila busckii]